MYWTSTVWLGCILAGVVGTAGCSSGDDEEPDLRQPVTAAIEKLQGAFAAGDMATICRHMTWTAKDQAGRVAHHFPTKCEPDVRRVFRIIRNGGGWSEAGAPTVERVRENGTDGAMATLVGPGGWRADVPLVSRGGRWKLAGFFGLAPAQFERISAISRARPFPPPARGSAVKAVDGGGRACETPADSDYPEISGGCSLTVATDSVPIRMLTPFGDFKFDDCGLSYRVSVDGEGRTWTSDWNTVGTTGPGCSDVQACEGQGFDHNPWKGRLSNDGRGGYLHEMDMCMTTCIGLFAGRFVVRLTRDGRRWSAAGTTRGATGFRLDGPLTVDGKGLALRPA